MIDNFLIRNTSRSYFSFVVKNYYDPQENDPKSGMLTGPVKESVEKIIDSGFSPSYFESEILFSDFKKNPKKRLEGCICTLGDTQYIFFMATNTIHDWLTNLFLFKKKVPYNNVHRKVKVHSGYVNRYTLNSVRTKILLETAKNTNIKNIIVSGYSMGGGLAPICAVDLGYNFPDKKVTCLAFAGPRVGNKKFVESVEKYTEDSLNLIYRNDAITKAPPKLFGFKHIKNRIFFSEERKWWKLNFKDHLPDRMFFTVF
jgi:triacylglycerol lipase